MKERINLVAFTTGLLIVLGILTPYNSIAEDTYIEATESTWGTISTNDGFDKTLTIFKDGDNVGIDDYGDDIDYTIEIQCSKKKLVVMVYSDPIGIYPTTTFTSIDGYALTKIDSGKVVKHPYIALKDSSGIQFKTPKPLTTAILKGKKTFSFKIPSSIQNDTVANFSIGDLPSYVSKFKSLGCSLK
jgi:hypothetical protein